MVLAVPTLLMGGTLPAAAQAVTRAGDVGRRDLAILYGSNTLGAVAGATLSTFVLLEALGTRRMLLSACVLNLAVAAIAALLATRMSARAADEPADAAEEAAAEAEAPVDAATSPRFTLGAAALVGFVFLLMDSRTRSGCDRTSNPLTRAVPLSGLRRVERILTMVVLPAPLEPSSAKILPRATSKSTPLRTCVSLNDFRNAFT